MAIATPPRRQTKVAAVGSRKRFSEVRDGISGATIKHTRAMPAAYTLKVNPRWSDSPVTPGQTISSADVTTSAATSVSSRIDGVLQRTVSNAGKTVQQMVDEWNAPSSSGAQEWVAGFADIAPVELVAAINNSAPNVNVNILLGNSDQLYISIRADTIARMYVAAGVNEANYGVGSRPPSYLDTDYNYPLDPATNPSQVGRGGGIASNQGEDILPQRASKFSTRQRARSAERNPAAARFATIVDTIMNNGLVAGVNEPLLYTITEADGNVVWQTQQPDTVLHIKVPKVVCRGAAFLTVVGNAGGAFATSGGGGMYGDLRIA